ncbi:hypothetical protein SORBI_3002G043900 [Sorghum bicolor]|uniref:Uncharacterized protein n=1 Tax=Sorghum bicolor TaxID=4558 RepID=A0A1B6Q956_SORBI|nr:hypothetical protein SORBI_3002G043900 [Sorghum bicolor]
MKLLWRSSFLFCLRNLYTLGNEKILELAILCCHSRSMCTHFAIVFFFFARYI